jgi:hypothetical protein
MMRTIKLVTVAICVGALMAGCAEKNDPSATSNVLLKMSASSVGGSATMSGRLSTGGRTQASNISLSEVKVNVREIEFEFEEEDDHFKMDSSFHEDNETKLKGPFIVDLINAGSFVDQVITDANVPNASYEKVKFKVAPSTESGSLNGKSILIKGLVGNIPFEFWHNARIKFGAKFSDSAAMVTNGTAVQLAIQLELDKILSVANGGVDLSKAKDGNADGTISINPLNEDGNGDLAFNIIKLLSHRIHCEREKK